jgi:hypothetical protein
MDSRSAIEFPSTADVKSRRWTLSLCVVAMMALIAVVLLGQLSPARSQAAQTQARRFGVDIEVNPTGAEIYRNRDWIGVAPLSIGERQGASMELEIRKPGYLTTRISARAGATGDPATMLSVRLPRVDGFQGVWQLQPSKHGGELEAFEISRVNDEVYVRKPTSNEQQHYQFDSSNETSVVFGIDVPSKTTSKAGCASVQRVEFRYTPSHDVLALRNEVVTTMGDDCRVTDRQWLAAQSLIRLR